MSDVTRLLSAIDAGDPQASGQLLPLVYEELRKLAAAKMAQELPGQSLQATALVHEAYLARVVRREPSGFGFRTDTAVSQDFLNAVFNEHDPENNPFTP